VVEKLTILSFPTILSLQTSTPPSTSNEDLGDTSEGEEEEGTIKSGIVPG